MNNISCKAISLCLTARLRKPQDGLFTGQIDAVDTANYTYRVTFDRPGLDRIYIVLYHNLMLYKAWKKSSKGLLLISLEKQEPMTKLNWNTKWSWSTSLESLFSVILPSLSEIVKLWWLVVEFYPLHVRVSVSPWLLTWLANYKACSQFFSNFIHKMAFLRYAFAVIKFWLFGTENINIIVFISPL